MAASIQVINGKVEGQNINEVLALKVCWLVSWIFLPLKFKGFWRISKAVCRVLGVSERQWLQLPNGLSFSVDMTDPYWNRLISPKFQYEPELTLLLQAMKDEDYCFIDCGANLGFWSCHAASNQFGQKKVLSVEPLNSNYQLLLQHAEKNELLLNTFKNAISDTNGENVPLFKPGGHASVSLVSQASGGNDNAEEIVSTITIDSMLDAELNTTDNFLLKLDVEGVEVKALQGASRLLEKQPLIIYEDHADDQTSVVSRYVMEELKYDVIYIDEFGKIEAVKDLEQLEKIKSEAGFGYNFLAYCPQSLFAQKVLTLLS